MSKGGDGYSSVNRTYIGDKLLNLLGVFSGTVRKFNTGRNVNTVRMQCLDCILYIVYRQSSGKQQELFVTRKLFDQIPVKGFAASGLGSIEDVSGNLGTFMVLLIVLHIRHVKCLQDRQCDLCQQFCGEKTVDLDIVKSCGRILYLPDFIGRRRYDDCNPFDLGGQMCSDSFCLRNGVISLAFFKKRTKPAKSTWC